MIKKLKAFSIIFSIFFSNFSSAENILLNNEVWHVVWVSSTTTPLTATWTRRPNQSNYYGVWSNELRANLIINYGITPQFSATARMNNGDQCTIRGSVHPISSGGKMFDSHYTCVKGDKGTATGSITS